MSNRPFVFMVMSFDEKYYQVFTLFQAIGGTRGIEVVRADEASSVIRKIRPRIFSKIKDADLVIAELSSGSPNVLYEIGWAHAMGKSTLLLAEQGVSIPFDINDYLVIRYDPNMQQQQLRRLFEPEFVKHLESARQSGRLQQPLIEILNSLEEIPSHDDLFTHLLGWTLERFALESKQWIGEAIHVGPAEAIEKGIKVFQLLKRGGFATYLVPLNAFWTTDNTYLEECRNAAKVRDVDISRVFILPNHEALFSESLRDHVTRDENAGIHTYIAFVDSIPEKDAIQDFGLWDQELLCLIEVGTAATNDEANVKGCLFTHEESSLTKAQLWKDNILSVSQSAPEMLRAVDLLQDNTKLLVRSAHHMKKYAHEYCRGSYLTRGDSSCEWYHGSWQYLRILGMVSTPEWHSDFYAHSFGEVFRHGIRDVLVSGLADYGIVQHLIRAIPQGQSENMIITVLDACAAPLQICRWFANRLETQFNLRYHQRDALETGFPEGTFDLITSDAFISRFNKDEQRQLVDEWHRILRPGGRVITTVRLSHGHEVRKTMASPYEIEDFVSRARKHIEVEKPWLRPMANNIANLALEYAQNFVSYPLPSEDYVRSLFDNFDLHYLKCGPTQGEFEGATEYFRIVAVRK